ncbi:hypothetical protein [Streptomyces albicerus]|uniref:hypothetical protein n=1 Tax=Streptomyces albicerus TaxID=2569859 RepID=UPI00124B8604|nr:hypothetical protein [Streptomyces albicerus]
MTAVESAGVLVESQHAVPEESRTGVPVLPAWSGRSCPDQEGAAAIAPAGRSLPTKLRVQIPAVRAVGRDSAAVGPLRPDTAGTGRKRARTGRTRTGRRA